MTTLTGFRCHPVFRSFETRLRYWYLGTLLFHSFNSSRCDMPPKTTAKSPGRAANGTAAGGGARKKPVNTARGYKRPETLPPGTLIEDKPNKKNWRVGDLKGQGGFADVYLVSDHTSKPVTETARYVLKVEPSNNGPLFQETKFFKAAAKKESIAAFMNRHNLKTLGMLEFIASGVLELNENELRWLIVPRLGRTVQEILDENNGIFSRQWVILLAIQLLDTLEYIHSQGYAHADIKAGNMMTGFTKAETGQVYLIDFGLVKKFMNEDGHIEYVENPKAAHDGTLELTSVDAHKGAAASRRGDLQILGFNLIKWLVGSLPWSDDNNADFVKSQKIGYLKNLTEFFRVAFPLNDAPKEIVDYFKKIKDLEYTQDPNYAQLREIFEKALKETKTRKSSLFVPPEDVGASTSTGAAPKKRVARKPSAGDGEADDKPVKIPTKRVKKAASTSSVLAISDDEDDDVPELPKSRASKPNGVKVAGRSSEPPLRDHTSESLARLPPGQRRKVKAALEDGAAGPSRLSADSTEDLSASLAKMPPGQRFKVKAALAAKKHDDSDEDYDVKPSSSRNSEPPKRPGRATAAVKKSYVDYVDSDEDKKPSRKPVGKRPKHDEF